MLEALCFDLNVPQSYNFLLEYARKSAVEAKEIIRSAWSLLNDSHLSVLCLLYRPEAIAAAALSLAVDRSETVKLEPGWERKLGVGETETRRARRWLMAIYEYVLSLKESGNGSRSEFSLLLVISRCNAGRPACR